MKYRYFPEKQGLYDPAFEHDSCGVGFVCNINGDKTYEIIKKGLNVLEHMSHRGAVGADPKTGDGAGILMQIPDDFFRSVCGKIKIELPAYGEYGTGLIFLPENENDRVFCEKAFETVVEEEGQICLGWRNVPVSDSIIGKTAKKTQPVIKQIFIKMGPGISGQLMFERKLYVIRKRIEKDIRTSAIGQKEFFYITNLSSRTFSYKGLLMPEQVTDFFVDLKDDLMKSAIALVHSRYSTNTFPTWDLAQPFRFLAHNGEINTLRGNINWFRARESLLASELFGEDIEKIKPVITEGKSDSAIIDNVFELFALSGRSLRQAMMMLIPSAWESDKFVDEKLKDFYTYHACFLEPWDGPAAIAFTDGTGIGAMLDRNGLRPARYIVTKSGCVIMASEMGVLDIEPEEILQSGRLTPGKMFFVDTGERRIIEDEEIKRTFADRSPYGQWLKRNMVDLSKVRTAADKVEPSEDLIKKLRSFGYTREDMKFILRPMAEEGKEPIGSMGNDTPHAFLSKQPQNLFNYFKQLFAQVTNPAIDPIREELVMTLESYIGFAGNILEETEDKCRALRVERPILRNNELEAIASNGIKGFKSRKISMLMDRSSGDDFEKVLTRICGEAEEAIAKGYSFIILSDKEIDNDRIALPSLLVSSCVHQHLVKKSLRSRVGIIIETGEPREVHHFALLFGYGVDCINPYLVFEAIKHLVDEGEISMDIDKAVNNYMHAVDKGILKILSKMGISTIRSYRGAQIFEALGLSTEIVDKYFTGTSSRIEGVDLGGIEKETRQRHENAFTERGASMPYLSSGGFYQWKRDGEFHLWNPESIAVFQDALRKNDYSKYKEFSELINDQTKNPTTLRGLLTFRDRKKIPVEKVEPIENIVKHFVTGAMSFGSISRLTHESIAIAMNRLKGQSNTGEGGEDPVRFQAKPNGDSARSSVKQVASGRFGVTTNYLVNADEIQIKIAQGAKPGEGGQLPGHKVSATIAHTRYTNEGVTLISPPPHHDIYSIEDLAQLIFDLKNVNPMARISVKLVSEIGVGTIAAGVAKGHADMILISGGDGGTGASPRSSIRHAGLPWELGLSETHQTLVLNDLRSRVRLQTDGQMRTGRDIAIAAILGAEEFGFGTAALIALGCVMLRHCHLNNCSMGVATQDHMLQKKFQGKPEYIVNYMHFVAKELREIMAGIGVKSLDEMVGRTDLLGLNRDILPEKAGRTDLSRILYKPEGYNDNEIKCTVRQDHRIDKVLDRRLIDLSRKSLDEREKTKEKITIRNTDRTTGAMLSGELCKKVGEIGLPEDTIHFKFNGVAGQSFAAFLMKGITFELEGMANDYVGKGIFGGNVIIYPGNKADYKDDENIIIGNTSFYGAISGEAYVRGVAGERFCIRNSGLYAVVEGVGDHGCEYMTGGRVLVIGKTGRNFGAGMSGGLAYIYDEDGKFSDRYNPAMVEMEELTEEDKTLVYYMLNKHFKYTKSPKADNIIGSYDSEIKKFIKVMPLEYKHLLKTKKLDQKLGLTEVSDG